MRSRAHRCQNSRKHPGRIFTLTFGARQCGENSRVDCKAQDCRIEVREIVVHLCEKCLASYRMPNRHFKRVMKILARGIAARALPTGETRGNDVPRAV